MVRVTSLSRTNARTQPRTRCLRTDRYIQMPWCSGGDLKAWLESRAPQRNVTEACLVLHDILRVRPLVAWAVRDVGRAVG